MLVRATILCVVAMSAALSAATAGDEATCRAAQKACEREGRRTECSAAGMSKQDRARCEALLDARCAKDYTVCVQAPIVGGATPTPTTPTLTQPQPTQPVTTPPVAASCTTLMGKLQKVSSVDLLLVTSYFAHGYRFMAQTPMKLVRPGPAQDLWGSGRRTKYAGSPDTRQSNAPILHPALISSQEPLSLRFRADGTIVFQDRYGPFTPFCWGDRFAGIFSGDSFETFTFKLP